ncbi:hypothetical protein ACFE04_028585 [Oxalis oulophora]
MSKVFEVNNEFGETNLSDNDLLAIFESLDNNNNVIDFPPLVTTCSDEASPPSTTTGRNIKKRKYCADNSGDGLQKLSHITVERNRRKQMNEHLTVLRTLMPCFYVKRGDQASIIGGVINYITELQQILQSLEAKKQRKVYNELLSPKIIPISSPRPILSPRLMSPRTPQPSSPYKMLQASCGYISPSTMASPTSSSTNSCINDTNGNINELVANLKSDVADVEVKFCGPNLVLKTMSPPIPGQATKIISALEELALEILHVNISTVDETMLNSFTIKIGIECQLSAEELAHQIQQTFC